MKLLFNCFYRKDFCTSFNVDIGAIANDIGQLIKVRVIYTGDEISSVR
ncbi:hypothetical protein H8L32_22320 [Undibacterium sp. CY18W]|uniref:Uncharacterized protein n=1 Tax=Undibacterium hunanense TaxID=2762292 RepID=A0ABR6ZWH3_9BURK|nr:hypothetical protein [Undibacterium hunanense]MBC3920216.1 hypothetical protein [Undibacterium hunanense]